MTQVQLPPKSLVLPLGETDLKSSQRIIKRQCQTVGGKLTEFLPPPIEKFAPVKSTANFFSIFLLLRAERCLTMIMKKNNMPIPRFDKGISVFARKSLTLAHNKRQRV